MSSRIIQQTGGKSLGFDQYSGSGSNGANTMFPSERRRVCGDACAASGSDDTLASAASSSAARRSGRSFGDGIKHTEAAVTISPYKKQQNP